MIGMSFRKHLSAGPLAAGALVLMDNDSFKSLSRRELSLLLGASACCGAAAKLPLQGNTSIAAGDLLVPVGGSHRALLTERFMKENPASPIMCWPVDARTRAPKTETSFNRVWVLRNRLGFVGYSVICQHAGCLVSDWDSGKHLLICPCHGSAYDIERDGEVVAGPAPLPLPHLPIAVKDDGLLRIADGFSGHVGAHVSRAD